MFWTRPNVFLKFHLYQRNIITLTSSTNKTHQIIERPCKLYIYHKSCGHNNSASGMNTHHYEVCKRISCKFEGRNIFGKIISHPNWIVSGAEICVKHIIGYKKPNTKLSRFYLHVYYILGNYER